MSAHRKPDRLRSIPYRGAPALSKLYRSPATSPSVSPTSTTGEIRSRYHTKSTGSLYLRIPANQNKPQGAKDPISAHLVTMGAHAMRAFRYILLVGRIQVRAPAPRCRRPRWRHCQWPRQGAEAQNAGKSQTLSDGEAVPAGFRWERQRNWAYRP